MNKKQILFELRKHIHLFEPDELKEILNDNVLSIEEKNACLIIRFSGDRNLRIWDVYTKYWYLNNQYHRENDQPAAIHSDGSLSWFFNGKLHRENDQPAVIYADGLMEWWEHGLFIKNSLS